MNAATLRDGCPACEDGYICRHGDGCIVDEAFGPTDSQKRRDAAAAPIRMDGFELWMCAQRPSQNVYRWMVYDVGAMEPHWFQEEQDARDFLARRQGQVVERVS